MALGAGVQASDPTVLLRWCPYLSTRVLLEGASDRVEDDDSPMALTWGNAATFERKKELRVYTEVSHTMGWGEGWSRWNWVPGGPGLES